MITFVSGIIDSVGTDDAVIDVNGIGFGVQVSGETAGQLMRIGTGNPAKLYTYMYVREEALGLYGFLEREELDLFKKLITVSGIGPRGALSLLSAMRAEELIFAIMSGDTKAISRAPGIGKKTAERLVIDLRDKLEMRTGEGADPDRFGNAGAGTGGAEGPDAEGTPEGDAIEALTALGYARAEAARAVRKAKDAGAQETEDLLKGALRYI